MPQATGDALATAIAADLSDPSNAAQLNAFSQFTVERKHAVQFNLESFTTPAILVYSRQQDWQLETREGARSEWPIELIVVGNLTSGGLAEVDQFKLFVDQILKFWIRKRKPTGIDHPLLAGVRVVPYDDRSIQSLAFLGVVELLFKGMEE